MGRINSCVKGKVFEREVAASLRAHGFANAKRGQQHAGGADSPDVVGLPGFHLECKHVEAFNLYDAMAQASNDANLDTIPVVVHKRNRRRPVAILDWEAFLGLLKPYHLDPYPGTDPAPDPATGSTLQALTPRQESPEHG